MSQQIGTPQKLSVRIYVLKNLKTGEMCLEVYSTDETTQFISCDRKDSKWIVTDIFVREIHF